MTVYLDTAFALNSAVNYFLLLSAARLAGAPIRRGRFLLAAALGGLYAAATFLPSLVFLRAAGMKAVLLAVMALAAFGARRQTIRLALLFAAKPAPALTPTMLGLASGLSSTPCNMTPDTASAAPESMAASVRGRRM